MPASSKPQFFTGTLNTRNPQPADTVVLTASTDNYVNTSPITQVTAKVVTETKTATYDMKLASGTTQSGVWRTEWTAPDNAGTFIITITATDEAGSTSSTDVVIR